MKNNQIQGNAKGPPAKSPVLRPLRYRTASIFLLVLYIGILLIPWVITCILMVRPVNASSYFNQVYGLPIKVINRVRHGWYAIEFFSQIQAVLAIPIVSGLLAQAAAVYAQRQSPKQKLSLPDLVTLANRPWTDVISWFRCFSRSGFVAFGGLLILPVTITPAIQAVLVQLENIHIVDCRDAPINACSSWNVPSEVGSDPSPSDLQYVPQNAVVQYVTQKLLQLSDYDEQPYMWPDSPLQFGDVPRNQLRSTFNWYIGDSRNGDSPNNETYFVSSIKNGSNTGILREHAMRLNSSIDCETAPSSAFPQVCPGDQPFETTFSAPEIFDIRICVPGASGRTPWNLTRDRQDLSEELWVDFAIHDSFMLGYYTKNFYHAVSSTLHCTVRSTRGYFEVNNDWNGGKPGPLLEKWPGPDELATEYNDFLGLDQAYGIPSASGDNSSSEYSHPFMEPPNDPFTFNEDNNIYAPGPLMTSALALFGNMTFFNAVSKVKNDTAPLTMTLLCQLNVIPFAQISIETLVYRIGSGGTGSICNYNSYQPPMKNQDDDALFYQQLAGAAFDLVAILNDTSVGTSALSMAMYFANEGLLTTTASKGSSSRRIFYSAGAVLTKPKWSLAAIVTVSILIGIQFFGLCALMAYTYFSPRWTDTLDAFAMVRVGAQLQRSGRVDLPGIRDTDSEDLKSLKDVDGLVGVAAEGSSGLPTGQNDSDIGDNKSEQHSPPSDGAIHKDGLGDARARKEGLTPPFELAVGGPGLVTRELARRKKPSADTNV